MEPVNVYDLLIYCGSVSSCHVYYQSMYTIIILYIIIMSYLISYVLYYKEVHAIV